MLGPRRDRGGRVRRQFAPSARRRSPQPSSAARSDSREQRRIDSCVDRRRVVAPSGRPGAPVAQGSRRSPPSPRRRRRPPRSARRSRQMPVLGKSAHEQTWPGLEVAHGSGSGPVTARLGNRRPACPAGATQMCLSRAGAGPRRMVTCRTSPVGPWAGGSSLANTPACELRAPTQSFGHARGSTTQISRVPACSSSEPTLGGGGAGRAPAVARTARVPGAGQWRGSRSRCA